MGGTSSMADEHVNGFPNEDTPTPPVAGGRDPATAGFPNIEILEERTEQGAAPSAKPARPEVEGGVIKLPVEQFAAMVGVLLAAMGGAPAAGETLPTFSLGSAVRRERRGGLAEEVEGEGAERTRGNEVEQEGEKGARAKEERSGMQGSRVRNGVRERRDEHERGTGGRATDFVNAGRREQRGAEQEEEVNYSHTREPGRNGKRRERNEGGMLGVETSVVRSTRGAETEGTSEQVRELRREMKKLREEALKGVGEVVPV